MWLPFPSFPLPSLSLPFSFQLHIQKGNAKEYCNLHVYTTSKQRPVDGLYQKNVCPKYVQAVRMSAHCIQVTKVSPFAATKRSFQLTVCRSLYLHIFAGLGSIFSGVCTPLCDLHSYTGVDKVSCCDCASGAAKFQGCLVEPIGILASLVPVVLPPFTVSSLFASLG